MYRLRVLLFVLCFCLASPAVAEIAITPLRQVITAENMAVAYRVANPSRRIVDGRVSWVDFAATETGYAHATQEQRQSLSAAPFLTVWPAAFRLEPGASTTISIAVRDPNRLEPGERRSHLLIETDAVRTPLRKAGGGIELDIGLGVSTPVFLRVGDGEAKAAVGETRLLRTADGFLELLTHIEPRGEFSAYGAVEILIRPEGAAPRLLQRIENIAAFIDAPRRRVVAPLDVEHLPSGVLEVHYRGRAEFDGVEFATRSFEIAPPR